MVLQLGQWKQILAITALKLIKNITQQRFQEMARYGIYQKWKRYLIKSFSYICKGLVLVHRHFLKPRNVSKHFIAANNNKIFKMKNYLLVLFVVLNLFSSCKKELPKKTEKQQFIRTWYDTVQGMPYRAKLIIKTNK